MQSGDHSLSTGSLALLATVVLGWAAAPATRGATETIGQQQSAKLSVRVVAPEPGTFISGSTTIRAELTSLRAMPVVRMTFRVDDSVVGVREEPPWETTFDAGDGFANHVIRVEAQDPAGRVAEDTVVTASLEAAVFRAEVDAVVLHVTVEDDAGRYVAGLTRDDFTIKEDGEAQGITYFASEPRPMVVGLLIDASGSMIVETSFHRAKMGALAFLKRLGPDDKAFVMSFDVFARVRQELTSSRRALEETINSIGYFDGSQGRGAEDIAAQGLRNVGGSDLNRAILQGVDRLADQPERRALVVFSDGLRNLLGPGEEDVAEHARRFGVRIYTIAISEDRLWQRRRHLSAERSLENDLDRGEATLRALADMTGGRAFLMGDLVDAYGRIAAELRSQYALAFQPGDPPLPGEWREVEVEVRGGTARTMPGYYGRARD